MNLCSTQDWHIILASIDRLYIILLELYLYYEKFAKSLFSISFFLKNLVHRVMGFITHTHISIHTEQERVRERFNFLVDSLFLLSSLNSLLSFTSGFLCSSGSFLPFYSAIFFFLLHFLSS